MTDPAPVTDGFDYLAVFMAAPPLMQRAIVMVMLAARDIPDTDLKQAQFILNRAAKIPDITPGAKDVIGCTGSILTAVNALRFKGEWPTPEAKD